MIRSIRRYFIGLHVTKSVRDELRKRAREDHKSVSRYVYELLVSALDLVDETEHTTEELVNDI